jgi:hypothetical protein
MKGNGRSLDKYTKEQIDDMIELRGLEKKVLEIQKKFNALVYYQPKTERLDECIRLYKMGDVMLQYDHVGRDHRSYGHVHPTKSINYKIAEEFQKIDDGNLRFAGDARSRALIICKRY